MTRTRGALLASLVLTILLGLALLRWYQMMGYLKKRELAVKHSFAESSASNASRPGVECFVRTGRLLPSFRYYVRPRTIEEDEHYYFVLQPRQTTSREDGWVSRQDDGTWYVKMF